MCQLLSVDGVIAFQGHAFKLFAQLLRFSLRVQRGVMSRAGDRVGAGETPRDCRSLAQMGIVQGWRRKAGG